MKLIEIGKEYIQKDLSELPVLTENKYANDLLYNLKEFPHAFVLGCLANFQMKSVERVWQIPYVVFTELKAFSMTDLLKHSESDFMSVFNEKRLHRFNDKVGIRFYQAIQKIHVEYNDNAANIWKNEPCASNVVSRFRSFEGAGPKISTMAVNILYRRFKVPFNDLTGIDISSDLHVRRVFRRMGYVDGNLSNEKTNKFVIKTAQKLYPEYPGIFDIGCWEIGKTYCHPKNERTPDCMNCPLSNECKKLINFE